MKFDSLRRAWFQNYAYLVLIAFIEAELFHDKRRNLTFYKNILAYFIGRE
jgi:hypothetical protein